MAALALKSDILVVDDEADIRALVADILKDEGYSTRMAKNSAEALAAIAEKEPQAIILDIWLKDSELDGLGILEVVRKKYPLLPVIMISGHGNIETAITSIRMGAYDYIEKPFKEDRLLLLTKRAMESAQMKREIEELRTKTAPESQLTGISATTHSLKTSIEKVAPTNSRVFITGPSGAGKEVVARMIHEKSTRRLHPFVILNASSLSPDQVDYELFGTEDTGDIHAAPRKVGVLERAAGGTLFIDEIADMPLASQARLLRVLQEQCFERIGGTRPVKLDVRIIAASSKDVLSEIKIGNLRQDLYYRINVVPFRVPALKERREDIPQLCDYFLVRSSELNGLPFRRLSPEALAVLQSYDWPGNVRQLKNLIEWLLIMAQGDSEAPITAAMLPQEVFTNDAFAATNELTTNMIAMPLREARELFEKHYLTAQVSRFGGNISKTSAFIGMERSALHRKLKLLGIHSDDKIESMAS